MHLGPEDSQRNWGTAEYVKLVAPLELIDDLGEYIWKRSETLNRNKRCTALMLECDSPGRQCYRNGLCGHSAQIDHHRYAFPVYTKRTTLHRIPFRSCEGLDQSPSA